MTRRCPKCGRFKSLICGKCTLAAIRELVALREYRETRPRVFARILAFLNIFVKPSEK